MANNYELHLTQANWSELPDIWDYMQDYEQDLFLEYGPREDWEQLFDQMPHHEMSDNNIHVTLETLGEQMFGLETQEEIDAMWDEFFDAFDSWEDFWEWFRENY